MQDWVLIITIFWHSNTVGASNTNTLIGFPSAELCNAAKAEIVNELSSKLAGGVDVSGHVVCIRRK